MRRHDDWRREASSNGVADLEPSSPGRSPLGWQGGSGRSGDPGKWDRVLSGDLGPDLARLAAERLAHLGGTGIATKVVKHVCRESGPLDTGAIDNNRAEVLASLAEVDSEVVADCIERFLDGHPDPSQIGGNVRHTLLRALAKIAFPASGFTVGARLMLRLLGAGDRTDGEHVARPFTALFPAMSGATEADGNRRLRFLDEAVATGDATRTRHVCARTGGRLRPGRALERDRPGSAWVAANPEPLAPGHDEGAGWICGRVHLPSRRTRFEE